MRLIEADGKEAVLTEEEWKKLLPRFNKANAKALYGPHKIRIPCYLCGEHYHYPDLCSPCPLYLWEKRDKGRCLTEGCLVLIARLLEGKTTHWTISAAEISWSPANHRIVCEHLDLVRESLLNLPKISYTEAKNRKIHPLGGKEE